MDKAKDKAFKIAIDQVEKQFGKGSVMVLGQDNRIGNIEVTSTGSIGLDYILGVGGFPQGRVMEIFGPEGSGKTTLALHMVAETQKVGGVAIFIDAEHALDTVYARNIGVDVDQLVVSQPSAGEEALGIAELFIRSGSVDLIVIDSVAALTPQAEIDGEMGDSHMGLQARLMSQAMRKLNGIASDTGCAIIFTNQLRDKIGVMFGSPETTPGGRALKFYASVRFDIRRIGAVKDGAHIIGNRTKVKIVKNKVAAPFKIAEFDIIYNKGINKYGEILELAVEFGFIDKSGTWYNLTENSERIGQGALTAQKFLADNPDITKDLISKIRQELALD